MRKRWIALFAFGLVLAVSTPSGAAGPAEAKSLVQRAIRAAGGDKKLAEYQAITAKFKGKLYFNGSPLECTGEQAVQYPDRQKLVLTLHFAGQTMTNLRVLNGNQGWIKQGDEAVTAMTREQVAEEKEQLYIRQLATLAVLRDKAFRLIPAGQVRVGGRPAAGVKVRCKGHREVTLYFDKKTGLLVKSKAEVKSPVTGTSVNQETYYDDYRKVAGVLRPYKLRIKQDGNDFLEVDETSDVKLRRRLDARQFSKP